MGTLCVPCGREGKRRRAATRSAFVAGVAAKNQTPLVRPRAALTRYAPGSCCFTPRPTAPPSEQTAPTPAAPLTLLPPTLLARPRTRTRRPRLLLVVVVARSLLSTNVVVSCAWFLGRSPSRWWRCSSRRWRGSAWRIRRSRSRRPAASRWRLSRWPSARPRPWCLRRPAEHGAHDRHARASQAHGRPRPRWRPCA